ncbi:MarC family protein [Chlamydia sp. 17-3921]|uniref:MarC family protein n=1 Tax=Chlamydia sp. 17-3921 TaxID=2675798 RepID=UPI00191AD7B6|nr:MarC family protein [Chlamydia sp. 17-3921]
MLLTLLNLSLLFYAMFDSPGSIPVFALFLKNYSYKRQQQIILRECLFALISLLLFITFGRKFLQFLDISLYSFQLIGGILLFSVALKMMLATPTSRDVEQSASEPIFFPLAFPIITGPAIITALLSYMEEDIYPKNLIFSAVIIAWILSLFTLLCSSFFNRVLGSSGLLALERLFSLVLMLMSVNLILKGLSIAFNLGFYVGNL